TPGGNGVVLTAPRAQSSLHQKRKIVPTITRLVAPAIVAFTWMQVLPAQEKVPTHFSVNVDMVVLTFTVTDAKGRYVNGLKPEDLHIREDGVTQTMVAF